MLFSFASPTDLKRDFETALKENRFVLYYQPIVDMNSKLIGIEALIRWNNVSMGFLMPDWFIPSAEKSGFIVELGDWVIREAGLARKRWFAEGLIDADQKVAVNVSTKQFVEGSLPARIRTIAAESGIDPQGIELEITETGTLEDTQAIASEVADLQNMGITFSVDDFGVGFSSVTYLERFPVRHLKIDKSLVARIGERIGEGMIEEIIKIAHASGVSVIAEGVESEEQVIFLKHSGCDAIQGYLIGKPMPEAEFIEYLKAGEGNKQ
jgi:diguanylate cyclase